MADFAQIINRLAVVRTYIVDAINDMGGTADESMTFAQLSNQIYALPTGMEHVRNGYQLFKENAEMTELPATLDFRQFDSMYQMCYKCTSLTRIPQLETANVTNMMWAFYGCSSLTEIDGLDTRSITSASELFHGCSSLTAIYSALDFSNVKSQIDTTFTSCKSLVEVRFALPCCLRRERECALCDCRDRVIVVDLDVIDIIAECEGVGFACLNREAPCAIRVHRHVADFLLQ